MKGEVMKLRDIYPGTYAVLRSGMVVAVVSHQKPPSKCIDGSGTIDMLNDVEARPLTKEDSVKVGDRGSLWAKNPEPVKDDGVHPGELKVGQFGLVINIGDISDASEGDIIQRIVPAGHEGAQFKVVGAYVHYSAFPEDFRVRPYPIGSKIAPQADGSIVVEEPEVNPLKFTDLEKGDYFTDEECGLAIKTREGATWLKTHDKADTGYSQKFEYVTKGPVKRLTPAEAAAIIAGQ